MMLSPQAARMGTVWTTLRKIGMNGRRVYAGGGGSGVVGSARPKMLWSRSLASGVRWSSTIQQETCVDTRYQGFQAAAAASPGHSNGFTTPGAKSHPEAWMVNLGRNDDNEWLSGPRPEHWFTGVSPESCPGVDRYGIIRSLPLPNLSGVTREAAKKYFDNSWTLYETLFAGLNGEEGFYRPPVHGLRHPQIFYYGHTACLYINKLRVSGVLDKPVNAHFESIFEVGVDEMLWDDMHKNDMVWPTVSEVHEYRQQVYDTVVNAILHHPALDGSAGPVQVNQQHPMWALFMGFEHERIHLETSSVLFREMPYHLVQTPENWPDLHPSAYAISSATKFPREGKEYPTNRMIEIGKNSVDLGKPADFPSFGWDNEYGERNMDVPPFASSEFMITNGEFWQFVADGGYRDQQYWCDDGWAWRAHRNMKWPYFWEATGPAGSNEFALRTIFQIIPMPWNWPVDVNYYEAKAFCRWKSVTSDAPRKKDFRLLTEAEHHVIRHKASNLQAARNDYNADKVMTTSGVEFPAGKTGANLNLAYASQNPVDYFAPSETGHRDTTGNAWEWTEDHFNPLKGFEVHHVYDDFSTPCFDGKHSMIVGGSFISTGDEASVFARFHFRPHFLQHSGFRLVASDYEAPATHLYAGAFEGQAARASTDAVAKPDGSGGNKGNVYETEQSLHMYLGLHYPNSGAKEGVASILPHANSPVHGLGFPQRVVELLNDLKPEHTNNKALDIGCAVGGASFELAKSFGFVDAFDFSASFVQAAQRMQSKNEMRFRVLVEAELYDEVDAVHNAGVTKNVRDKVHFFTGDACKLHDLQAHGILDTYDGVIMSNLLCRLPDPLACIEGLPRVVNKGGVVVLVTPFSWLSEFTPRQNWLGGFYDPVTSQALRSKDALQTLMEACGFEKIHEGEMPLVIREHQRKYQYIISQATGWRRI